VPYLLLGHGSVVLQLLDRPVGHEIPHAQLQRADGDQNQSEQQRGASDDSRGSGREHPAFLQGGHRGFEQNNKCWNEQNRAADNKAEREGRSTEILRQLHARKLGLLAQQHRHLCDHIAKKIGYGSILGYECHGAFSSAWDWWARAGVLDEVRGLGQSLLGVARASRLRGALVALFNC
jgi:hypothetical protein